jgi:polysaccharide chain length determinant protein (PEP-CTERM system associated)
MHELLTQLLTYARGMWRYRWYALLVAWVVCLAGWTFVYTLPEEYESHARIQINTRSLLDPLLRGLAVRPDIETQLQMMTQTLLSRANIQKVVAKLDPNRAASGADLLGFQERLVTASDNPLDQFRAPVVGDSADVVPFNTDALTRRIQGKITIQSPRGRRPFGGSQIYGITYRDENPEMAHRVVQALLTVLVEETLDESRADTDTAQRFLDEQIGQYEARLQAAEQRLAEFKKKNAGMMEGERVDYYSRLRAAKEELEATRAKLSIAINRREELSRQLEGDEPVFGIISPAGTFRAGGQTSTFDIRIQEHQRQLDELLLKYTDKHPEVIALRAMIAQLEKKKRQELQAQKAMRGNTSAGPVELNPVIQRLHIALNETEVEIATLRVQLAGQESKVSELEKRVDTIPELEAQLARLNRDYEITKRNYEALKERLELARLGEQADQGGGKAIRVLNPPAVPRAPAGDRRLLYLTAVLFAGFLGGAGLAFVLHEIRPVFTNSKTLRDAIGLPVLGVVSMKFTPAQQRKLRLQFTSFVFAALLLVAGYGATVVFQDIGVRIAQRLVA